MRRHDVEIDDAAHVGDRVRFHEARGWRQPRPPRPPIRWGRVVGHLVRLYVAWVILWLAPQIVAPTTHPLVEIYALLRHVPKPPLPF